MSIGLKIRALRFSRDISEAELAQSIGVTEDKLKFWEKDLNRPTNAVLTKIAEHFKIDIDYFFEDDTAPVKTANTKIVKADTTAHKKTADEPVEKIQNFKTQITAKKKEQALEKAEIEKKAAETNTAGATLSELKNMNTKLDEIISILKNKPDMSKIKKIETTYSLENANALLKEGWILLELFKDEKGFLGYRLGASF